MNPRNGMSAKPREDFLFIDSEPNRNLWANDMSHLIYQETDTDIFDVETQLLLPDGIPVPGSTVLS